MPSCEPQYLTTPVRNCPRQRLTGRLPGLLRIASRLISVRQSSQYFHRKKWNLEIKATPAPWTPLEYQYPHRNHPLEVRMSAGNTPLGTAPKYAILRSRVPPRCHKQPLYSDDGSRHHSLPRKLLPSVIMICPNLLATDGRLSEQATAPYPWN